MSLAYQRGTNNCSFFTSLPFLLCLFPRLLSSYIHQGPHIPGNILCCCNLVPRGMFWERRISSGSEQWMQFKCTLQLLMQMAWALPRSMGTGWEREIIPVISLLLLLMDYHAKAQLERRSPLGGHEDFGWGTKESKMDLYACISFP